MADIDPQKVTVYGRLSFPTFTYAEALRFNKTSEYPKTDDKVSPNFSLLLEQHMYDKFVNHLKDAFFPFLVQREAAGEKRNALTQKDVDRIIKVIDNGLEDQPPYLALKPVSEKTAELAPEAIASLKIQGNAGQDMDLKAIVNDESELSVPDPDQLTWPVVKPIGQTVHRMYGGCYVAATMNLAAYVSGKLPGFSAYANTAVFKADGPRFGGGVDFDEDEIFLD